MISLKIKKVVKMEAEKRSEIQAHAKAIAKLLYEETDPEKLKSFEEIEKTVRQQLLEYVDPEIGNFLSKKRVKQKQGE